MAEALCYSLKFTDRIDNPAVADDPEEVVNDKLIRQITDFGLKGLAVEGVRLTDDGEITGAVNWLLAKNVKTANFYTTKTPVPMLLVSLPNESSPDWKAEMPGFINFVKDTDQTLNLGEIKLEPSMELNTAFQQRLHSLGHISDANKGNLLEALAGEGKLDEFLDNITGADLDHINAFR